MQQIIGNKKVAFEYFWKKQKGFPENVRAFCEKLLQQIKEKHLKGFDALWVLRWVSFNKYILAGTAAAREAAVAAAASAATY